MSLRVVLTVVLAATLASPARAADLAPATGADAYRFVSAYADLGLHRTGTAGGAATAAWLADTFRSIGLETSVQDFTFGRFLPHGASVTAGGFSPEVFPLYYSGRTAGVTGELVDVGLGTPLDLAGRDLTGKIALIEVPMPLPGLVPTLGNAITNVTNAHAAALVAAIDGPENFISSPDVDARAGTCRLPILMIGKVDGEELRLHAGQTAAVVLDAEVGEATAPNVLGVLPGASDDVLVIGTPITGWFAAASERGAGIGVMLTLARALAARGTLPQTVMFLGTSGHEVGFLGLERFLQANPSLLSHVTAYLHLGAAVGVSGDVEVLDHVVRTSSQAPVRLLTASENPIVAGAAWSSALANGVVPLLPAPQGVGTSGEELYMYLAGVPVAAIKSTFLWIHTPRDLPDTTSPALLDPVVRMYGAMIDTLLAADPATVRSANGVASLLAATVPPLPLAIGVIACSGPKEGS